jgi:hypothetical protein
MRRLSRWLSWPCLTAVLLAITPPPALAQDRLLPLAVKADQCEFVLPAGPPGEKYYLIVGSLARSAGPHRVIVRTEPTIITPTLPVEETDPDPNWVRQNRELADRLSMARATRAVIDQFEPLAEPPRQRTFHLFVKSQAFQDAAGYVAVTAELRGVGKHCQVYVERDQPEAAALQPTIDEAIRTFDEEIYPHSCRTQGHCLDVDRDGRFTILFSGWLSKLSDGKVALDGFVRGSDFSRDLPAPYSNRCDMMYLNTRLRPDAHLRTLLAHEYTHAIDFCEHVCTPYLPDQPAREEEGWLNEALAHVAEDQHDFSWSNLDYRVSAFLSAPGRYQLVVPDYHAAGWWRSHGHRGAAYLFVRWCVDHCGADLPGRLIQSNLRGVQNLEVAAGEPFAELFRQWTAALLLSGRGLPVPGTPLRRFGLQEALGDRLLCGPRIEDMPLVEGRRELTLAGTSAAYLLMHSPGEGRTRITISAEEGADLQVSLVRLPDDSARLTLRCDQVTADSCRLLLTAHDSAVVMDGAAWERMVPELNRREDTSFRPDQSPGAWLGRKRIEAGETRTSFLIELPSDRGEGPWVFKVSGHDAAGHAVAAWAVLPEGHHPPASADSSNTRAPGPSTSCRSSRNRSPLSDNK